MHIETEQPELESTETDAAGSKPSLTAADRCDECGAQAYIRVELASGDLLFCGHHGNEKRDALEPIAISWHDETEKLLSR